MAEFGKRAEAAWKVLDAHLATHEYVAAKRLTIADLSLCGYLFFDDEIGVDWAAYPNIRRWLAALKATPRWRRPYRLMPDIRARPDRVRHRIRAVDARRDVRRQPRRDGALVDDLRAKTAAIEGGGGEASCARHVARGKLLPRERVRALLDPGSPFLELSAFAAYGMYDDTMTRRE